MTRRDYSESFNFGTGWGRFRQVTRVAKDLPETMQIQSEEPQFGGRRPVEVGFNHGHLETTPVGDRSWRVSDMSVPEEDARHVVAFVEARDCVEIVWIRGARTVPGPFDDIDRALDAIDDVITTGEIRDSA